MHDGYSAAETTGLISEFQLSSHLSADQGGKEDFYC